MHLTPSRALCQGEDIVFERDGAGQLRKLGEGAFGQARASKSVWRAQSCILTHVVTRMWHPKNLAV